MNEGNKIQCMHNDPELGKTNFFFQRNFQWEEDRSDISNLFANYPEDVIY